MKLYVCVPDFDKNCLKMLRSKGIHVTLHKHNRPSPKELRSISSEYDLIIIGVSEKLTKQMHPNTTLRFIGSLSIGTDHIDNTFITDPNITILNCPTANTSSVAEYVFGLIIVFEKNLNFILKTDSSAHHTNHASHDLRGKTLGVIGAGSIGRKVIELGLAFEMRPICHTFHPQHHQDLSDSGVRFVSLKELMHKADIITIHLPLTRESRGLISKKLLSCTKSGSIIINTSRLDITDNQALFDLASSNHFRGVGVDGDFEPKELDRFNQLPNIIATPHLAGKSAHANLRMDKEMTSHLVNFLNSHQP